MAGDSYEINFNSLAIGGWGGNVGKIPFHIVHLAVMSILGVVSISIHKQIPNLCLKLFS